MIDFRQATAEDYPELHVIPLRKADQDEINAAFGVNPNVALVASARASLLADVITCDERIIGVYGLGSSPWEGVVMPWLVCTDEVYEFQRALLRYSRQRVRDFFDYGHTLFNFVDSRNSVSIKWLEWLGFQIWREPVVLHDKTVPFYPFHMRR